eukprot:109873_1
MICFLVRFAFISLTQCFLDAIMHYSITMMFTFPCLYYLHYSYYIFEIHSAINPTHESLQFPVIVDPTVHLASSDHRPSLSTSAPRRVIGFSKHVILRLARIN